MRPVRQQHLPHRGVAQRHAQMQVGQVVQRIAGVVHLVAQPERLGEMRGLQHRRQPALVRNIAAQIVGRLLGQPDRIGIQTAGGKLRRHDRDIQLLAQLDVVVDVLVGQRVFVPVKPHLLDRPADTQRIGVGVAPGGIEHDTEVVAHRLAHRLAHLDVGIGIARRMDLVRLPAVRLKSLRLVNIGGDVWQARDLARQVPQRSIDSTDRAIADGTIDQPHAAVDALAFQRVLAHQHRLQRANQLRPVHRRRIGGRPQESVPLQPGIGMDPQQPEIAVADSGRAGVVVRRRDVVPGEDRQRDVVDFHAVLLRSVMPARTKPRHCRA